MYTLFSHFIHTRSFYKAEMCSFQGFSVKESPGLRKTPCLNKG